MYRQWCERKLVEKQTFSTFPTIFTASENSIYCMVIFRNASTHFSSAVAVADTADSHTSDTMPVDAPVKARPPLRYEKTDPGFYPALKTPGTPTSI